MAPMETIPGVPTPAWKVERQIELSDFVLQKSQEEVLQAAKKERERIKQRNWEEYNKPTLGESLEADMACFIINQHVGHQPPGPKLTEFTAPTVLSAFNIVDRDEEKVTISKFIRENRYCVPDPELRKVIPSISPPFQKTIFETLSCNIPYKEDKHPYYYQTPVEDYPTRRKFVKHARI